MKLKLLNKTGVSKHFTMLVFHAMHTNQNIYLNKRCVEVMHRYCWYHASLPRPKFIIKSDSIILKTIPLHLPPNTYSHRRPFLHSAHFSNRSNVKCSTHNIRIKYHPTSHATVPNNAPLDTTSLSLPPLSFKSLKDFRATPVLV